MDTGMETASGSSSDLLKLDLGEREQTGIDQHLIRITG